MSHITNLHTHESRLLSPIGQGGKVFLQPSLAVHHPVVLPHELGHQFPVGGSLDLGLDHLNLLIGLLLDVLHHLAPEASSIQFLRGLVVQGKSSDLALVRSGPVGLPDSIGVVFGASAHELVDVGPLPELLHFVGQLPQKGPFLTEIFATGPHHTHRANCDKNTKFGGHNYSLYSLFQYFH